MSALGAWAAAYVVLLLALMWSRHVQVSYLIGAGVLWTLSCGLLLRARPSRLVSLPLVAAVAFLAILLASQAFAAWRIARISTDWPELVSARRANLTAMLDREVGRVVERGQRAAALAAQNASNTDTAAVFREIMQLRQRYKVDALAVFGEAGGLIAWAGEHRAKLPDPVRRGIQRSLFVEQPLYSYVYFPARVEGGSTHVVAAVLLGTALHEHAHDLDSNAAHVMSHVGASFRAGSGPTGSWPLVVGADTVAHARLTPIIQSAWRADAVELAQRVTTLIAALVIALLGIAWLRWPSRRLGTMVPLLAATAAVAIAPLRAFGLEQLFSPALFLLPLPADISLGTLLGVLIALGALAASLKATARVPRLPTLLLALGALAIAAGYPGAIRLLVGPSAGTTSDQVRAAGAQLLLGGPALWFGLQIAAVLLLGIITELALPRWTWSLPLQATARSRSPWVLMLIGALATGGALSVVVLMVGETTQNLSPWIAAAWALPFLLAAFAISAFSGKGVRLIRWVTAGWLATTAVLPYMWVAHVDARLKAAERALATLGSNPDPYLEFLLMQFAREAGTRARSGESGYLLLYRSWVGSGLARESYPARITIWSRDGIPEVQLPIGKLEETGAERRLAVPRYMESAFARVRASPDSTELMRVQAVANVNQVLIRTLDSAHVVTVEVPPRRTLGQRDVPFLASSTQEDTRVELVPARADLPPPSRTWVPSERGWRSETLVRYVEGEYHAHMEVRVPGFGVRIARGVLLLALDLTFFTLLWLVGRAARGEHLALRSGWRDWRGSFRARVTATLFFFFLIPTAAFGWVAFGALAREVSRATRIVAERAVRQAVVEFKEAGGDLAELASHTGSDVLYYFQGELDAASSPEARDLGVYGAWMPAGLYQSLTRADEDAAVGTRRIAGQEVLTAYRALPPAGTLAVPMSLESGDTAVRQGELAHLMLFAALIGGLLSLLLSVVVGRALTGPIGRLQRAAAQVGSGNLRVRLPEQTGDEFGQLYASFNRMVRRLRRARTQELRTARVLAWGEMARQVAHEIKNPLTPIKLAVQHLKRAYSDGKTDFAGTLNQSVEQILLEIDRLSEIARAFSRYGAPEASTGPLEPVNVPLVIHEALTLYRAGDPDVEYRDEIELDVPRALGRSGELKEVLLNLLENARAALAEQGGRIVVTARRNHDGIELAISDNGPGIPSDFLPRVFDPHFSTRSAGTGLGLAIVRRLVESWGGRVDAESQLGAGTTIRVTLLEAL
jgi:signal transduction histidine kinase